MGSFLKAVEYVLTNSALEENDPRLHFIEGIKNSEIVERNTASTKGLKFIRLPSGHMLSIFQT